jgi:hypothetical protein
MARDVRCATTGDRRGDAVLLALGDRERDEQGLERLVVGVLRSALEQRVTREAKDAARSRAVPPCGGAGDMMVDRVIPLGQALRPLGLSRASTRTWRQERAGSRPRRIG